MELVEYGGGVLVVGVEFEGLPVVFDCFFFVACFHMGFAQGVVGIGGVGVEFYSHVEGPYGLGELFFVEEVVAHSVEAIFRDVGMIGFFFPDVPVHDGGCVELTCCDPFIGGFLIVGYFFSCGRLALESAQVIGEVDAGGVDFASGLGIELDITLSVFADEFTFSAVI